MSTAAALLAAPFHRDVTFADLDLPAADLRGKEFFRCTFRGCRFPESRWETANLERCGLERADLSLAQHVFVDPAKNRVKGLRVPLEAAVALAQSFGMQVPGHDGEPPASRRG